MSERRHEAMQRYLDELKRELDREAVPAAEEALSDAREFLQAEADAARRTGIDFGEQELYSRFVARFGAPRIVALGYRDVEASGAASRRKWCASIKQAPWKGAAAAVYIVAVAVGLCVAGYLKEPPKLSPFTEVRYDENAKDKVVVRFQDRLYRLEAIDSIPTASILQTARDQFGDRWQKRFAEDLVEVFWAMGHKPGRSVRLELHDMKTDKAVTIEEAAMTEANRQRIWLARNGEALIKFALSGNPEEPPKLSPFTEVRYDDDVVVVRFRGELYRLESLDGIPTKKILQSARDQFGDLWQKRFAEDLVEVLWGMDHRPGESVRLELRDLKTNESVTIEKARMTEANRRQIRFSRDREAVIDRALDKSQEPPKISPFTEVTFDEEGAIVRFQGERYRLVALDGIPAERILQSARQKFGELWQKRFAEDLVEVLWAMGHRPDVAVSLKLKDLKSKETVTIDDAPMTSENRLAIWQDRHKRGE